MAQIVTCPIVAEPRSQRGGLLFQAATRACLQLTELASHWGLQVASWRYPPKLNGMQSQHVAPGPATAFEAAIFTHARPGALHFGDPGSLRRGFQAHGADAEESPLQKQTSCLAQI